MSLVDSVLDMLDDGRLCAYCAARFSLRIGQAFYQQRPDEIRAALYQSHRDPPAAPPPAGCVVCCGMVGVLADPSIRGRVEAALAASGHQYTGSYSFSFVIPQGIFARERALVLFLKEKHGVASFEPYRLKETLRWAVSKQLAWAYEIDAPLRVVLEVYHQQVADEETRLFFETVQRRQKRDEALTTAMVEKMAEKISRAKLEESAPRA